MEIHWRKPQSHIPEPLRKLGITTSAARAIASRKEDEIHNPPTYELINCATLEELKALGSTKLALEYFEFALKVPSHSLAIKDVASRLKACFGNDNNKEAFELERGLLENFNQANQKEQLKTLNCLELLCNCESLEEPGKSLAILYYLARSVNGRNVDNELLETVLNLHPKYIDQFAHQLFSQELDQYTSAHRLARFYQAAEALIEAYVMPERFINWDEYKTHKRSIEYLTNQLLTRNDPNLNFAAECLLERTSDVYIQNGESFVGYVKFLPRTENALAVSSKVLVSYFEQLKSFPEIISRELSELYYEEELLDQLLNDGLIEVLDLKNLDPVISLCKRCPIAGAYVSVALLKEIISKLQKNEDIGELTKMLLQLSENSSWNVQTAIQFTDSMKELEKLGATDFLYSVLPQFLFNAMEHRIAGKVFCHTSLLEILSSSPSFPFKGQLTRHLTDCRRIDDSSNIEHLKSFYKPLVLLSLAGKYTPEQLSPRLCTKFFFRQHRAEAIMEILSEYISDEILRSELMSNSMDCNKDPRTKLLQVSRFLERFSHPDAKGAFVNSSLKLIFDSRCGIASMENDRELENALSKFLSPPIKHVEDDGA